MSEQWKPGDVTVLGGMRAMFVGSASSPERWEFADGSTALAEVVPAYRPLVVIDPEGDRQVERLCDLLYGGHAGDVVSRVRIALRKYLTPPVHVEEPTGLGAVVEDAEGRQWIRNYADPDSAPWRSAQVVRNFIGWRFWDDVHAVRILFEGVPS